ncbi:MAG TPA: hypothetical protein VFS92_01485 [Planctomycetota bacterium]|nr:hypothetical protein [Planctomycetota bacterium]
MTRRVLPALLAAAAAAGCVSETRSTGFDPASAAARAGWSDAGNTGERVPDDAPHDGMFDPAPRDPDDVVTVPQEAYQPLDRFFDNEGYLLGDRIVIECSYEPFVARLVALAYNDHNAKYVLREEGREAGVHWVRVRALNDGPAYQSEFLPKATFGSQRRPPEVKGPDGKPIGIAVRPVFEFVGTKEVLVRMHLRQDKSRPVWLHARAEGLPDPLSPDRVRDCVYVNANRRMRGRGPVIGLRLEVRRGADGRWEGIVEDGSTEGPK